MTALLLTGCGGTTAQKSLEVYAQPPEPRIQEAPLARELESLPEIDGKKIDAVTAMPSVLFGGSFVRCSYIYEGFHEKVASSKSLFQ